jgi:hypothetical protein
LPGVLRGEFPDAVTALKAAKEQEALVTLERFEECVRNSDLAMVNLVAPGLLATGLATVSS